MAKKKTREQKILADSRHFSYHLETNSAQVSSPSVQKPTFKLDLTPSKAATTTSYSYVRTDIRKTAIVTAGILITQIVLYFLINRL